MIFINCGITGDHDRQKNEAEQTIQVIQIITHERYGRLNNDIALLKLSRPVMFNNKVQPICLPRQGEEPAVGSKCYITGNISLLLVIFK